MGTPSNVEVNDVLYGTEGSEENVDDKALGNVDDAAEDEQEEGQVKVLLTPAIETFNDGKS